MATFESGHGLSRRGSRVRVPSAPPFYWVLNSVKKSTSLELVFLFAAIHGAHPVGPTLRVVQNCSGQFCIFKIRLPGDSIQSVA